MAGHAGAGGASTATEPERYTRAGPAATLTSSEHSDKLAKGAPLGSAACVRCASVRSPGADMSAMPRHRAGG